MEYLNDFQEWEKNFKADAFLKWHSEMTDIPIITIALYLTIIFGVPKILSRPLELKKLFAVWNLGLSIFSICGASRVVPFLYDAYMKHGFEYTICKTPTQWYSSGPVGVWMMFFIYSKIPELCDTFFLVLRGKKVIFLHWFHHVTVLLYVAFLDLVRARVKKKHPNKNTHTHTRNQTYHKNQFIKQILLAFLSHKNREWYLVRGNELLRSLGYVLLLLYGKYRIF